MRNLLLTVGLLCIVSGCSVVHPKASPLKPQSVPRELCKATLPAYRIEPPDILDVEVVRTVPRANYLLNTTDVLRVQVARNSLEKLVSGDLLSIRVPGAPAVSPIDANYLIQPDGTVSLGTPYGSVPVAGLNVEQARKAIETALSEQLVAEDAFVALAQAAIPVDGEFQIEIDGSIDFGKPFGRVHLDGVTLEQTRQLLTRHFSQEVADPTVTVSLVRSSSLQQVAGEHLVGPDGRITLGMYGSVRVVGLTVEEASWAIEQALSETLDEPRVATSVLSYNSKLFYIITQGAGIGDAVFRFPVTGNETVLDALSLIQGVPQGSSSEMWIARPSNNGDYQVLPIEWEELTALGDTCTNYQLLPGDRLYVQRDPFVTLDTRLAKFISPLERILGFSILKAETATRYSGKVLRGGGNPNGRF